MRACITDALLLPDASVLVAGGGAPGPLRTSTPRSITRRTSSTPRARARRGRRSPQRLTPCMPGERLPIGVRGRGHVSRVSFIKTGSATHSVNMDQRFIQLPFTANGGTARRQLPSRAGDVPPGYYMLFVLNDQGVPSVARMVRVGNTTGSADPGSPD